MGRRGGETHRRQERDTKTAEGSGERRRPGRRRAAGTKPDRGDSGEQGTTAAAVLPEEPRPRDPRFHSFRGRRTHRLVDAIFVAPPTASSQAGSDTGGRTLRAGLLCASHSRAVCASTGREAGQKAGDPNDAS